MQDQDQRDHRPCIKCCACNLSTPKSCAWRFCWSCSASSCACWLSCWSRVAAFPNIHRSYLCQMCQCRRQGMCKGPTPPRPPKRCNSKFIISHNRIIMILLCSSKHNWQRISAPGDITFLTHQVGQMNRCLITKSVNRIPQPSANMINMRICWLPDDSYASQAGGRYRPCFTKIWLADTSWQGEAFQHGRLLVCASVILLFESPHVVHCKCSHGSVVERMPLLFFLPASTAPIVRHSSKVDLQKPVQVLPSTIIYIQDAFSEGESGQEMFLSTVSALVSKSLPSEGDNRHQFAPHETGQTTTSVLMHRQQDVLFPPYLCQNYILYTSSI